MKTPSIREWIRQRLQAEQGPVTGDHALAGLIREERELTPAAVLVPLVDRAEGVTVLLTQRTDHLEHHAGQISFPGGRAEDSDEDPVATALRETEEEIGLHRRHVEVAGFMSLYQTITGFLVTPVVGFVEPRFELTLDAFEVAEVFEVPLKFVLDSRNHERHQVDFKGQRRCYYVLPYQGRYIWGATAAMLVGLATRLEGYPF